MLVGVLSGTCCGLLILACVGGTKAQYLGSRLACYCFYNVVVDLTTLLNYLLTGAWVVVVDSC